MCSPSAAIGVIGAVVQFVGDRQQAQAETRRNDLILRNQEIARENAVKALARTEGLNQIQAENIKDAAALRGFKIQVEGERRLATARVSAGEAGVSGVSLAQLESEINFNTGLAFQDLDAEMDSALLTNYGRRMSDRAQAKAAINANAGPVIDPASPSIFPILGVAAKGAADAGMFDGIGLPGQ